MTNGQGQLVQFLIRPGNGAAAKGRPTPLDGVPLHELRELLGDKAQDRNAVRAGLAALGIAATIPGKANRKEPLRFDQWRYQGWRLVENAFSDRQQFRGLACRYAKRADRYAGRGRPASWFLRTKRPHCPVSAYPKATAADCSNIPAPSTGASGSSVEKILPSQEVQVENQLMPLTRPGPQTLLLTALALLIVAATIMLACGPAAQQLADSGEDPAAEPTATPTPVPTVCLQGTDWDGTKFEHCITPMPPKTPKYPNLSGDLEDRLVEFEEAQDAASQAAGPNGSAVDDPVINVEVFFSTPNTSAVALWLRSKGVMPVDLEKELETYFVEDVGYIGGAIPLSLLGELSRQKGVVEVREPYPLVPTPYPYP